VALQRILYIIVLSSLLYCKKILIIHITFEYEYPDVVEKLIYMLGDDYVNESQSPGVLIMCSA
jgi:hypothetical protein